MNPEIPRCGARTSSGEHCAIPAGRGTHHPGTGRCKLHGGASAGPPIKHGRYASVGNLELARKTREHAADPRPGDLAGELALMRAVVEHLAGSFDGSLEHADGLQKALGRVASIVEKAHKIETATALTQVEIKLLAAKTADILMKYLPDLATREAALSELQRAIDVPGRAAGEAAAG